MDKNKEEQFKKYLERLDYLGNKEDKTPLEEVEMAEIFLNTDRPYDAIKILQEHINTLNDNVYYNYVMGLTLKRLGNHVAGFRYLYRVYLNEENEEFIKTLFNQVSECLEEISLPNVYPYRERVERAWSEFEANFSKFQQALLLKEHKKAKDIVLKAFNAVLDIEYFEIGNNDDKVFLRFSPLGKQEELYKLVYVSKLKPEIENFAFDIALEMVDFDKLPVNDEKFYLSELKYKLEEENQLLKLKIYDPFKKNNFVNVVKALSDALLVTLISDFEFIDKEVDGMVLRDELLNDIKEIMGKNVFNKVKNIKQALSINKRFDFEPKYDNWIPRIDIVSQDTMFEKAFISFIKDDDRLFEDYYLNGIILGSLIFESSSKRLPEEINDLLTELIEKNVLLFTGFGYGIYLYVDLVIFDFNKFYDIVNNFFSQNKNLKDLISVNYHTLYQQAIAKEVIRYEVKEKEEK